MNKKFLYAGIGMLFSVSVMAQKDPNAVKFSAAVSPENARKHLSIIASDEYEGRETGKKGAWMAADYIKAHFKKIGLTGPVKNSSDPYFQPVGYSAYKLTKSNFSVNGQAKEEFKDYMINPGMVSMNGYAVAGNNVLFAGYGISKDGFNEYAGQDVKGKVVMVFATGDPSAPPAAAPTQDQTGRRRFPAVVGPTATKIKYLLENKAAGVILIDPALDNPNARMINSIKNPNPSLKTESRMKSMEANSALPVVSINTATANQLLAGANTTVEDLKKKITESKTPATVSLNVPVAFSAAKEEVKYRAENVLGFLEGSDPKLKNEVLVVTGHYDHIGLVQDPNAVDKVNNGADDDGSGTTGVLIIAEAFANAKKAGHGPKRSILFMTVCGEEKGLLGSEWYSEHPIFPVENTIADLNTDMIGRIGEEYLGKPDSANYIYSVGSFRLSTELGKISENIAKTYMGNMILDYKFDDPKDPQNIYFRSDHYNFAKLGIPVIFYYDGMLQQDYHKPGDEVSKINFDLLSKRAHLTFYTAWELANRANRPVVDKQPDGATRN